MDDDDGTRGEHRRGYERYVGYTICLSVFCLPHAGYGGGTTTRRMVATAMDNMYIAEESTLAILYLCVVVPHAGYSGGTTTTTGREDNMYIVEESTLAILPVCCCSFLLLSLCCLPHAGGTTTRRMVATTTG